MYDMDFSIDMCLSSTFISQLAPSKNITVGYLPSSIPKSSLRRSSALTKQVLTFSDFVFKTNPNYIVFATCHGELGRTLSLLYSIAEKTELSPIKFAQSVHSTAPGILTIVNNQQVPFTTVCAGEDTFIMAIIEAIAHLTNNPKDEVCIIFADENTPNELANFLGDNGSYSLAIKLRVGGNYQIKVENSKSQLTKKEQNNNGDVMSFVNNISNLEEFELNTSSLNLIWKLSNDDIKTT
ncbi:hypothetical protein BCU68_03640 [Vibrio sp. 10N.286.49.B3]|nr:hypothetical protein BCU68_03640 [Vibrio sp. 10N.286.49.B3]